MNNPFKAIAPTLSFLSCLAVLPSSAKAECSPNGYLGEICWTASYQGCPSDFAEAAGQLLPISQYSALYSLYGTAYGGDGRTTFALPNLYKRAVIGYGSAPGTTPSQTQRGQAIGMPEINISNAGAPPHTHNIDLQGITYEHELKISISDGTTDMPEGGYLAKSKAFQSPPYAPSSVLTDANKVTMANTLISHNWSIENGTTGQPIAAPSPDAIPPSGHDESAVSWSAVPITAPRIALHACIALTGTFPPRP